MCALRFAVGKSARVGHVMKRKYPDGPRIKLPIVIIGQMLPKRFPFDPLTFAARIARDFGDIAHYKLGPLHVYQLNHPTLIQ
jgi:hypothetical protein